MEEQNNEDKIQERKQQYNTMWRGNDERVIREFLNDMFTNKEESEKCTIEEYVKVHLDNKYKQ